MKNYSEMLLHIEGSDYETHFWNAIRGKKGQKELMSKGIDTNTGDFTLTPKGQNKYMAAVKKEGLFCSLATDIRAYDYNYHIKTANGEDVAVWVPEGSTIPITDGIADFSDIALASHKLAVFLKLEDAFIKDDTFNIEDYLVSRLAKNFGRAEDNGFINGTGADMPTGILAESGSAEVSVSASAITYEDLVKLFFSVKPK